ncbi:MAG: UDP-glucose dehydrogenase family protein, partial [Chitinophagaceae bacterium]
GKIMTGYKVIVDKSTVPVGTAEKVRETIARHYAGEFDVVSNPEFLREGVAVDDFMKPDRVVIGVSGERAQKIMGDLYKPFVRSGNPVIYMDVRSAELTKYAANSFLATKITFMNEIAVLCERLGADVDMIRKGMGSDERIGKRFLFPGIGYGGSCFPKDVQALLHSASEVQYPFKILQAVVEVNDHMKAYLLPKLYAYLGGKIAGKKIAMWGLAFKPNTDDIREAPALSMIRQLLNDGARVAAFDPEAMHQVKLQLGDQIEYAGSPYECLREADALLIATEWNEFRNPDFSQIEKLLKNKAIFDGRNIFEPDVLRERGFHYESIGRARVAPENLK